LDNIYVNKLTMKQLTTSIAINICELVYSCEHSESVVYSTTINIIQIKYILLQCKYDTQWII